MGEIPEGYEPAENSAAKDIAMEAIEGYCDENGIDTDPDVVDAAIDLITLADVVVEALLKAGITIPEGLKSPYER